MENPMPTPDESVATTLLSLQQLINNLVNSFLPAAHRNHTKLVNEVRQEIALGRSTADLATEIIHDLVKTVVMNADRGDIHISAERFNDTILLQIQERNNNNGYALSYSIGAIEPSAHSAGGHITINGPQKRVATISFSFPDQLAA